MLCSTDDGAMLSFGFRIATVAGWRKPFRVAFVTRRSLLRSRFQVLRPLADRISVGMHHITTLACCAIQRPSSPAPGIGNSCQRNRCRYAPDHKRHQITDLACCAILRTALLAYRSGPQWPNQHLWSRGPSTNMLTVSRLTPCGCGPTWRCYLW